MAGPSRTDPSANRPVIPDVMLCLDAVDMLGHLEFSIGPPLYHFRCLFFSFFLPIHSTGTSPFFFRDCVRDSEFIIVVVVVWVVVVLCFNQYTLVGAGRLRREVAPVEAGFVRLFAPSLIVSERAKGAVEAFRLVRAELEASLPGVRWSGAQGRAG